MINKVAKPLVLFSFFLAFLFVFTPLVGAVEGSLTTAPVKKVMEQKNSNAATDGAKAKVRACQRKQTNIKRRSDNLIRRVNLIIDRFDRITNRVKEYYNNKLVPKGITVENYDQLLADIEAKKQAAKDAASIASDTAKGFSCDSADPKAQLGQFRTEVTNVIRALKEYKKSVIDFLVAVRTKGKNIKSPGATSSATPSAN